MIQNYRFNDLWMVVMAIYSKKQFLNGLRNRKINNESSILKRQNFCVRNSEQIIKISKIEIKEWYSIYVKENK